MPGSDRSAGRRALLLLAAAALLAPGAGCIEREPVGDVGEPNLATVQSQIFTPRCASADCHGGPSPRQGLDLEPGKSVDSLVGVTAKEAPLFLVAPGDSEASYLIHKLRGTFEDVGGSGERMPLDATPLSEPEITLVAAWIDELTVELPPPTITSVTPASASVNATVVVAGENFGLEQGTSTITFGTTDASAQVSSWAVDSIQVTVPGSLDPGSRPIVVTVGDQATDPFPFEVLSGIVPSVFGIVPDTSVVGATVELRGSNFGDSQDGGTVSFGSVDADTYVSWSNTKVAVEVPAGASTGDVTITAGGTESNAVSFWVVGPTLSSIQEAIFTRRCTVDCHNAALSDPSPATDCPPAAITGSLDLRDGQAYAGLVGVDSCMLPGTARVVAGNRAASLLFSKIASDAPSAGERMPKDGQALSDEVVEVIGSWIDSGAANN